MDPESPAGIKCGGYNGYTSCPLPYKCSLVAKNNWVGNLCNTGYGEQGVCKAHDDDLICEDGYVQCFCEDTFGWDE